MRLNGLNVPDKTSVHQNHLLPHHFVDCQHKTYRTDNMASQPPPRYAPESRLVAFKRVTATDLLLAVPTGRAES
jgi:hypothetical protein